MTDKEHDIFLSYSSKDRERVIPLMELLKDLGWSVWWDRDIPPGKTFDEFIEENLNLSRIVVVVWSKSSIHSRWVRTEANEGLRTESLVPVED